MKDMSYSNGVLFEESFQQSLKEKFYYTDAAPDHEKGGCNYET